MNDPKTGFNYALSNDLAVLAVKSRFSECVEMEIADNFIPNSEVYVAGYPSNPNYCSPCLKVLNEDEIEDEITKAFCNFDKRVISEGTIMNQRTIMLLSQTIQVLQVCQGVLLLL